MRVRVGQRIDRYQLIEPLGAGGQGTVWKAEDLVDRGVLRALKLVPIERTTPEAFERARREAHALAPAPHPALVLCHGLFEDIAAGVAGIVLDLVEGEPLTDLMRDPRMTPAHRTALLLQVAEAIAFVHERNIVHRDLKPDNVLVTGEFWAQPAAPGTVKLVDFGIAVDLGNPRPLTATGAVLGTIPYLAPELVAPDIVGRSTEASEERGFGRDMFAFGVLATEMLLGRHPTGLPNEASIEQFARTYRAAARGEVVFPPRDLAGPFAEAIAACLALDPVRRPRSGTELLQMLRGSRSPVRTIADAPLTASLRPSEPGPTIAMTAPTPAPPRVTQPSSPRFDAPGAGPVGIPSPPPPPPTLPVSRAPLLVTGAIGGALLATLTTVLLLRGGTSGANEEETSGPPIALPSAMIGSSFDPAKRAMPDPSTTSAFLTPEPTPIATAPSPTSACPAPCCGGTECTPSADNRKYCNDEDGHCNRCESDRTCIPGACETSYLDPMGHFLLRLARARHHAGGDEPVREDAQVCLRRSLDPEGPWTCTRLSDRNDRDKADRTRLPVQTTDLVRDGIDIELRLGRNTFASRYVARQPGVKVGALCIGLVFRELKPTEAWSPDESYSVTLYLDDPVF